MTSQKSIRDDFNSFFKEWVKEYRDIISILYYLKTYPEILSKIELENIQDPKKIDSEQNDWIKLCSKFTHPLEKEFFKPYWIPIVKDSLVYFIDISDDNYPIFEAKFYWLKPYKWYKKHLTHSVIELLLAPDEGINIDDFYNRNEREYWETIKQLGKNRRNLGNE